LGETIWLSISKVEYLFATIDWLSAIPYNSQIGWHSAPDLIDSIGE
jgi:hypothetical protein